MVNYHTADAQPPHGKETDTVADMVTRGRMWMKQNAGCMYSTAQGADQPEALEIYDNFVQLLILEVTGDLSLVSPVQHPSGKWNYFKGKGQLTDECHPCDLDTTSLATIVLECDDTYAHKTMDEMLDYLSFQGISMVYFDHSRPCVDAAVCVNTLRLFYQYNRGRDLPQTLEWVLTVLRDRSYLPTGTKYYEPEFFLYFLSGLLRASSDPELNAILEPLLKERIQERFGVEGDSIALGMRIIVADLLGIRDEVDLRALITLQNEDGGWELGWMYRYGRVKVRIGSRGLATALAVNAIERMTASGLSVTSKASAFQARGSRWTSSSFSTRRSQPLFLSNSILTSRIAKELTNLLVRSQASISEFLYKFSHHFSAE